MKRFLSLFISMALLGTMIFSGVGFSVKAAGNLIPNYSFESGLTGWKEQGTLDMVTSPLPVSGYYSCHATNRSAGYASPMMDITNIIKQWGYGSYLISAYVKIDGSLASNSMSLVINNNHYEDRKWYTATATINNTGFTKIEGTVNLLSSTDLINSLFYLQSSGSTYYNFYCDDFSIIKVNGIMEPIPPIPPRAVDTVLNRSEDTLVGAIRWDAWLNPSLPTFGGADPQNYIGAQVARSLSPAKYHFRLPYFGIIQSENQVTFPDYTQEIFDQEILYAKAAGLDYFMYCWYADDSGMDLARKYHAQSQYRNDVKMSAMWDITSFASSQFAAYIDILKQSYWQKVDNGRPLIYISNGDQQSTYALNRFRQACIDAGLKNPYLVGIGTFGSTPALVLSQGLDAYSNYASFGGDGKPFATLAAATESKWASDAAQGVQIIPLVSTGWDNRPRYDNPVTWTTATANGWIQTATPAEIATHLLNAIQFNKTHKSSTNINSVLFYAWNEHDEGGWLCPTVSVDGSGLPLLNTDGSYVVNSGRIDAIQPVILGNKTAQFTVSSVSGYRGKNVIVNIDVSSYSNIAAATFTIGYDTSKLQYLSYTAGSAVGDGMLDVNADSSTITIVYINANGLTAGGSMLQLQFKIKDGLTDQVTPLNFSVTEMSDLNDQTLPFNITQGSVTIMDYKPGDVNKSGTISAIDALFALQISTGKLKPTEYTSVSADVNNSGTITSMDALMILQVSTGKRSGF